MPNEALLTVLFVVASAFCTAFGNSLQPISILAWAQPLLALVAYDRLVLLRPAWGDRRPKLFHVTGAAILCVSNACGGAVAFAGALGYPVTTFASLAGAFCFALVISASTTLVPLLGTHLAYNKWPSGAAAALVLPCFTVCIHTLITSSISSYVSPSVAVMDYEPLRQMCAVWGAPGTVFLMSATAVVAYLHIAAARPSLLGRHKDRSMLTRQDLEYQRLGGTDADAGQHSDHEEGHVGSAATSAGSTGEAQYSIAVLHRATGLLLLLWCFVASVGGFLSQADFFYQVDVTTLVPRTIQVSCIIESAERVDSPGWERLWQRTEERLALGDTVVLWAEESVNITFGAGEERLLTRGQELINKHGNRSYLGLLYQALHEDTKLYTNRFTLLKPDGGIAWQYDKAYPVPLVESEVIPGDAVLPIHDAPFGRLSGAICFDFDQPQYILKAAHQNVDIMFQPSWTWGSVGPRHFADNQLRALEGGFTLVRCSTSGVSGVVTPKGQVVEQVLTGPSGEMVFSVPLIRHRWTPYVQLGLYWAELLNLGLAAVLWIVVLVPQSHTATGAA